MLINATEDFLSVMVLHGQFHPNELMDTEFVARYPEATCK